EKSILAGKIKVNGEIVSLNHILGPSDVIEHEIHRHEPAVSATLPKIVFDSDDLLIVDKPPSIPVHPTGIYHANTVSEILKHENRLAFVGNVNRLDRLTSGLLIIATNPSKASDLTLLMVGRKIHKEYIAKVYGKFDSNRVNSEFVQVETISGESTIKCDAPLLKIEHKLSISMVSCNGKPSTTLFRLFGYNQVENTSLIICIPLTGRTHQIRTHLLFL
ncbi:unnamed protein product, partial [Sphagnum compactum]